MIISTQLSPNKSILGLRYLKRQHGVARCSDIKLLCCGDCSKASWKNGIDSR